MLNENTQAPNFSLPNQAGENIDLSAFNGQKNVALYFYPKDDTSGCTLEAQQFTAYLNDFTASDTVIIGVSKDNCESHQNFIKKYDLKVELLADTDGTLCDVYGVWQEKEKKGVKKMGIVRSTFIINKAGLLTSVEYGVKADGHALQVLKQVQKLMA